MKYCKNCGTQMEDAAAFCPSCGTPVAQPPQAQPPQAFAPQQPYAPQPPQGDPSAVWQGGYAQPPQKKPKTGLIVGIIAAVVVIAAAAVLLVLLLPGKPVDQFKAGLTSFAESLYQLPSNEVATRMKNEPYDVSLSTDLSKLMSQMAQGQSMGIPDNTTLKADIKNTGKNGGMRVSLSSGGTDLLKAVAIVTDDKLIAGFSSPMMGDGSMQSAALKLNGKPGDPLVSRLSGLSSTGVDQQKQVELGQKMLTYFYASIDEKWITMEDASITDAISGDTVKTKAATLTLDADKTIQLLKSLSDKLDADPTFYDDLDKMLQSSGNSGGDSKEQFKQQIQQAEQSLEGQKFELKIKVHYKGSTPVAIEAVFDNVEVPDDYDFLLEKSTSGNSTVYLFSIKPGSDNPTQGNLVVKLNIESSAKQTKLDGKFDLNMGNGDTVHVSLTATSDIEKKSSNDYAIDTKVSVNWNGPSDYSIGTGSVDAELNEDVAFGSAVKSVQEDSDYMYDELNGNAKEVSTLEEFVQALVGTGVLPSLY